MTKTAWLFPGQGSQHVGMAMAWAERSACAREALDEASDVLGFDVPALLLDGPAERLDETYNAQPALLASSVAILRAASDDLAPPSYVAGHSMGEYSALVAAGAMAYPDALRLVRERGRLMKEAGERSPGGMLAVLGLDDEVVEEACNHISGVQVANYNAPGQVVISGTVDAVAAASERLQELGAKRVVRLAVSIAAHSELMAPAAEHFAPAVHATPMGEAAPPLVANVTAQPTRHADALRQELVGGLRAPVRWTESVRWMADQGVTEFLEIGPGTVLTGLVRRIARGGEAIRAESLALPTA